MKVDCEGARVESRKPVRTSSSNPDKRQVAGLTVAGVMRHEWGFWKENECRANKFPNRRDVGDDRSVRNDSQIFVISHYLRWEGCG